jgi:DNA repair protein RecN (Recombination protein N)
VNAADGRKTAWVNDRRASGEVLRALSDVLVELHGQQDDRGLLDPRNHRAMLDDFGGFGRAARRRRRGLGGAGDDAEGAGDGRGAAGGDAPRGGVPAPCRRRDRALAPRQGEEAELDARRRLMQAAEKMRADVARAVAALSPDGAEGQIGRCAPLARRVDGPRRWRARRALAALERAMVELGEAQSEVAGFADRLVFNPAELEETEERLFALRGLARKHGIVVDDLERFGAELEARVAALDGGAEEIAGLRAAHTGRRGSLARCGRPAEPCAGGGGGAARRGHGGRAGAAEAGARGVLHRARPRRSGADRRRCRDLHRRHQPRRARGAAEPHRLGRGACRGSFWR